MKCYACLLETGRDEQSAVAICQRCGAGICPVHLVEVRARHVVGPAGSGTPGFSLFCCRCYNATTNLHVAPRKRSSRRSEFAFLACWQRWWKSLWPRRESGLPTSEEAVAAAEAFLKRQQRR